MKWRRVRIEFPLGPDRNPDFEKHCFNTFGNILNKKEKLNKISLYSIYRSIVAAVCHMTNMILEKKKIRQTK